MVLEKLGESLKQTLGKIASALFVDEKLINELIRDIQRALLQADVNVNLVFSLTNKIKERALKEETPPGLTKKEYLIKIVYEELVNFVGKEEGKIEITKKPTKIMLVGLFGSGKTTTAGKLARYYSKRGHSVVLLGLDTHRPAAMEQLGQIANSANVPFLIDKNEKNPIKIIQKYSDEISSYDIVIADTSGRDALSEDLIEEIKEINKHLEPDEKLLVISADIGQAAQRQAEEFHKSCGITGVIVTKMDGTAKAGGALTACATSSAKIKFIGTGEKIDDIEVFRPEGFVSRLLGMGDLKALLEKAEEVMSRDNVEELAERFMKGEFNLIDLYEQMNAMRKMGPLAKITEMIPGFSQIKLPKEILQVQEENLKKWKYIMDSMTEEELKNPDILNIKRIERIARGSGTNVKDVRELIKHYRQSIKFMKLIKGKNPKHLEKMFKKLGGNKLNLKF